MITLDFVYIFAGIVFALFALLGLYDRRNPRRFGNAAFWGLLATSMILGDYLGDFGNGLLVLALVAIAGTGQIGRGRGGDVPAEVQAARALRYGNFLLLVALIIPVVALAGTFLFKWIPGLADPKQATLISLAIGVLIALAVGMARLKPPALLPLQQGRRLLDAVGWAAILPQMLASLGAVFALAGVGEVVGGLIGAAIPEGSLFGAVLAFGLGMALFTMVMGNAFAAFPVMMAAVGLPLLIKHYDGDPAVVAAIGMLAGFCGTLMTPMAANFNLVPAALLELKSPYGVIRAQVGTALPLLAVNILFIYIFAF
ncbi:MULTISPECIES: DUF979 domain-containing protein [unclassified Sphingopyxis]|uniref:DUF979 domain-containing protein n=1 Tax=unclassified Sphingopyxis TaxID=2614943 RepID=UPI0007315C7C|nr:MULTISPECIES: DUF979 domain-containing protein [unclassified Sphingopyxis]KTE23722.1 hypothetical protein ATE61_16005 [Sphingopyxis sp. H057]KTE50187.1 hypothetical protein ATE64_17215 [Sphingopyxis sp. H073]KTE50577.1 hypothetical protein ATE69_17695 [Sphingopyxis sp. H071]KTE59862.1 hypothetical protein ATE66_09715 [Sphingopyxis sp. H107]KTE63645.1 hypothetical protein ATE65_14400 [Sphingopyxis sp. H100]